MEHKNIEVFFSFLEQNLTEPVDNRETWIHRLEKSAEVTGSSRFELSGKETKSGLPDRSNARTMSMPSPLLRMFSK
jgi:hypothetical protein